MTIDNFLNQRVVCERGPSPCTQSVRSCLRSRALRLSGNKIKTSDFWIRQTLFLIDCEGCKIGDGLNAEYKSLTGEDFTIKNKRKAPGRGRARGNTLAERTCPHCGRVFKNAWGVSSHTKSQLCYWNRWWAL